MVKIQFKNSIKRSYDRMNFTRSLNNPLILLTNQATAVGVTVDEIKILENNQANHAAIVNSLEADHTQQNEYLNHLDLILSGSL